MAPYCERLWEKLCRQDWPVPAREGRVVHLYLRSAVFILQVRLAQSEALVNSSIF